MRRYRVIVSRGVERGLLVFVRGFRMLEKCNVHIEEAQAALRPALQ